MKLCRLPYPFVAHTSLSFYGDVKRYSGTDQHMNFPYVQFYETSHSSINMGGNARRARSMKCVFTLLRWADQMRFPRRLTLHLLNQVAKEITFCNNPTSVHIADMLIFGQDRGPHKSGGGIVVYIRNSFKASIIDNLSTTTDANSQQLWLKVQCRK